ncbi:hypothetical protein E2C01_011022 [Portunus trituberculatus]|uniref:Uncharacterized protein n=1 Tax=Portunus trituberculatus TaxID=210409 RepID=A0A5B7DA70_PORTR|nr:hypothetical protein [Portunus trituberculatus]
MTQDRYDKFAAAVVQWSHACFGVCGVSKRIGSNPVHSPSLDLEGLANSCAGPPLLRLARDKNISMNTNDTETFLTFRGKLLGDAQ